MALHIFIFAIFFLLVIRSTGGLNPCEASIEPCFNGGTCIAGNGGSYTCDCLSGFSGQFCEIVLNACQVATEPCFNGGTCIPSGSSYTCECPSGYGGQFCNIEIADYVTADLSGNLNIIISAPHGGSDRLNDVTPPVPDREHGCYNSTSGKCVYQHGCEPRDSTNCEVKTLSDLETDDLAQRLRTEIYNIKGSYPKIVICNVHRSKLDANREREPATFNQEIPMMVYDLYHETILNAISMLPGPGFLLDIHGYFDSLRFATFCGYMIAGQHLNDPVDSNLDLLADQSSIRLLAARRAPEIRFSNLLRGPSSLGAKLEVVGQSAIPSPQNTGPGNGKYLAGQYSYTTNRYSGQIDTVQIEVHSVHRTGETYRQSFAEDLAQAVVDFYNEHYDINECLLTPLPCFNGGTCIDGAGNYTCDCPSGYNGHFCETDINECISSEEPCRNGGTCDDGVNGYTCICPDGFTGGICETDINECISSEEPCRNGGTCDDGVNGYTCICPDGFTGEICEKDINECNSSEEPCRNGGTCDDGVNGYTCICPDGFTGGICETDIDECDSFSEPCLNGGTCVDGVNSYTCSCPDDYTGNVCETDISCHSSESSDESCEDSSEDSDEEDHQFSWRYRVIRTVCSFPVNALSIDFNNRWMYAYQVKRILRQFKKYYKRRIGRFFRRARISRIWPGSLNVDSTVEVDNTTEAAAEAITAIIFLTTGQETIEVLGQNVSATSISLDGYVVSAIASADELCSMYTSVVECPSESQCVIRDSVLSCEPRSMASDDKPALQEKLIHLIIGLCCGTVFCILVLVVIIVVLSWNRRKNGIYLVHPRNGPMRSVFLKDRLPTNDSLKA